MSSEPGRAAMRLDELLDFAPCGFLAFSDDGTVELANATLLDMLGYQRDELVGHRVEQILTLGSRIFYQTHWFPLLRLHGHAEEIFLILRCKSGDEVGVLVNAVHRDHGGGAYHCVVMRVRERQKFEDELLRARRAAEQARAELETQKQELLWANQQLEEQALELKLQQQLLQEQTVQLEESGEELRVINEDLVARTEEAEHLRTVAEEANQAKSAFLAVMSHELRTPLNAIAGYVELLEMGIHGPLTDAQREALDRIARSERHLLRLINEVLNLARIEAGHVEYELEDIRIAELVAAVLPMVEPQIERRRQALSVAVDPQLAVRVDRDKVQQILLNLLGNAIKFTPDGGRIAVAAARPGSTSGAVSIRVSDTGVGIPPEKLEAVFQPFVQVDTSRTRAAQGSGLGLAISRDLARGMGGDLSAESVHGQGSTFTLALPTAHGPPGPRAGGPTTAESGFPA